MTANMRAVTAAVSIVAALPFSQVAPPIAGAEDEQHNVIYRARVDGLARGAQIAYRIDDAQVQHADPTMLPGRTFEANAVLTDPQAAGIAVSIQWPYSANLHCEILVDGAIVAQADQFIAPTRTRNLDDPDYGMLPCGAPLSNATSGVHAGHGGPGGPGQNIANTDPADASIPMTPSAPAEAAPAP